MAKKKSKITGTKTRKISETKTRIIIDNKEHKEIRLTASKKKKTDK